MADTAARLALTFLAFTCAGAAQAEEPLSAIEWLSRSAAIPAVTPPPDAGDVTGSAATEDIAVSPIDEPTADAVGLLSADVTGLPADLWRGSTQDEVARAIAAFDTETLPAVRALFVRLLLAETRPPEAAAHADALFLSRIDKLVQFGALDQAAALLDRAGATTPDRFARWIDVALLIGTEDRACDLLERNPELAPDYPTRIFCLARSGDWDAAALTLHNAEALGVIDPTEDALLARFLDGELFEGDAPLDPPERPSALVFRLFEAIGEPLSTTTLPLAFAQSDLRPNHGWKARIEAAERLARTGAIEPNRLIGLYTGGRPAASGGVWDRVEAVQRFDTALDVGDPGAVAGALPDVWAQMQAAELEIPFADLYADRLARLPLSGAADTLANRIGLLSDSYETAAMRLDPTDAQNRFLRGVATGEMSGLVARGDLQGAIRDGFRITGTPGPYAATLDESGLGRAILEALQELTAAARGDLDGLADALGFLRSAGLEETARRAALELMILDRQG